MRALLLENNEVKQQLGEQDFERLLDCRGADLAAWPVAEQGGAATLLASSARARAALADARLLDTVLANALAPVPPPLGLKARILARAERKRGRFGWLTGSAWRRVGMAGAPLLLGFGLGVAFGLDRMEDPDDLESLVLLAFSASDFVDLELPEPSAGVREGLAPRMKEPPAEGPGLQETDQ